ncbi:MAG: hypothetical protein Q8Q09_24035 [Deltaproteobacteria bacterium]|nr:hypothetical protein [Deltaproteobacteria bacterium]
MKRRARWFLGMALSSLLAVSVSASATVVVPLSRQELTDQSDVVVRATVVSRLSRWNDDHSQIITLTRVRVTETVKGHAERELVIRQFGGEVDGLVSEVAGDGRLVQGQHVVLFLRRGPEVYFLTALAQAVFVVTMDPQSSATVQRRLEGLTFARWVNGRMAASEASAEPVETLEHLLRDLRAIAGRRP